MQLNFRRLLSSAPSDLSQAQEHLVAVEKLNHILRAAKSSIIPGFLGLLLCIPIFAESAGSTRFYLWFGIAIVCLCIRSYLVFSIKPGDNIKTGFHKLNWAIGLCSAYWGLGWLLLIQTFTLDRYFLFYCIDLIFIFINIYGNCVNWSALLSLIVPTHIFLALFFLQVPDPGADWPLVIGAGLFFFYSLKLGHMFSISWEKNLILRFKNETLLEELTEQKNASVAANIAKSDFIATASHDLRQPMQAINIFLALINSNQLGDYEKQLIDKLKTSAEHLNKMFNTLLDISKLDAQSILVKEGFFDIELIAFGLDEILRQIAASKNLKLRFQYKPMEVFGDKVLLNQILINLISNALQYTKVGSVDVDFINDSQALIIKVSDTGCGMSNEDLGSIFKEFYRGQHTRTMHDGLGLGLSIVSRVVKLIGATLTVQSELNKGTIFTLKTPFAISEPSNDLDANSDIDDLIRYDAPKFASLNALHLAVIEDDRALIQGYQQYFSAAGFIVHLIPLSAEEFQTELMQIERLDFILSDYRLGDQNGVDYIKRIREEFNCDIPALIITADTSPDHIKRFEDLNIKTLHKPIRPDEILSQISKHFQ